MSSKDGKKKNFEFPTRTIYQIYLYIISFITLIIAVVGAATAFKAALAYTIETPFSYTLYRGASFKEMKLYDSTITENDFEICPDLDVLRIGDSDYCVDHQAKSSDLVTGLTLFISMMILFAIHQYAISKISKKKRLQWLETIYMFLSLILYSVIGLISIPVSIYQLANYLITKPENYAFTTPNAPAMAIGIALFSLPLWVYFLLKVSKNR